MRAKGISTCDDGIQHSDAGDSGIVEENAFTERSSFHQQSRSQYGQRGWIRRCSLARYDAEESYREGYLECAQGRTQGGCRGRFLAVSAHRLVSAFRRSPRLQLNAMVRLLRQSRL